MDNIVNAANSKKLSLSIYGNDYETKDGTAIRDFIHIQDLLDAHFLALPYLDNLRGYEVLNVGTGKPTTVLELVNTFMDAHEIKFKLNFCNRRPGDIAVCYADNAKIQKELGWQGMGTGYLSQKMDKKEERIKEFVAKIMEKYPPGMEQ